MTQSHRSQRRYYLSDIPLEEARDRFYSALHRAGALDTMPAEQVSLANARGRITAGPIWAVASSPHYDAAAMDGIAVRAADTTGATETSPMTLAVGGPEPQAVWVDTGDPMPRGFDAVIMIEHLHLVGEDHVSIMAPVAPWQHVRPLGEDIVATELVLPENHRLTPADLGACAAAGLREIPVRRRPSVAIIPTGNELVPVGAGGAGGDIVEFNSLILSGLLEEWGAAPRVFEPAPDVFLAIRDAAMAALNEHDLVIINAGSSAGAEDYTALVVEELGQLLVHGIAVRPGHPVVLGVAEGKPLVGLPGYPVSAILTAELLIKPLIERWLGLAGGSQRPTVHARITRKVTSPSGEDEFLRVKLGRVGEKIVATPVQRGAGVIMSLVRADGLVKIPRFSEGVDVGAEVTVDLLRPLAEVENTIVAIGSHDLTLDLMSSFLRRVPGGVNLSSSHIGSLGGLIALRRGEAHLAGSHLLDESTGEYNLSYIERFLPPGARNAGKPGGAGSGAHRQVGQSPGNNLVAGPAALRSNLRQPPAGLGHPGAAGLQAEGNGRPAGTGLRLRAGGVQPPGRGCGGQRRGRRRGAGHSERGPRPGPGLHTPAERAVRPGNSSRLLRKRPAATAAGPPVQ